MNDLNSHFYTWNKSGSSNVTVELEDDSLRDGLQAAFVKPVNITQKLALLENILEVGVQHVVLGYPATSNEDYRDCEQMLTSEVASAGRDYWLLSRTNRQDIRKVLDLRDSTGRDVGVSLFIGVNPLRRTIENWNWQESLRHISDQLQVLKNEKVKFSFNIEDATRTPPQDIKEILDLVLCYSPYSFAVCDTVGDAHPDAALKLISFIKNEIDAQQSSSKILWHGHNDKGLALANSLAAVEAGAQIVSGSFFSLGERAGNVSLEQVALYLNEKYSTKYNLKNLPKFAELIETILDFELPDNLPLVGRRCFATGLGVHASAILKAKNIDPDLAERIYNGVAPSLVGRNIEVVFNPSSGRANLRFMLKILNSNIEEDQFEKIFCFLKSEKGTYDLDSLSKKMYQIIGKGI